MGPLVRRLDGLARGLEVAAAAILGIVTVLTFVAVVLRYAFSASVPDTYDFGRNFHGILIFWGIAVAGYRSDHIAVDLLWASAGRAGRRAMDIFAELVSFACMAVFVWMQGEKVLQTKASGLSTYDLHLPVWTFYGVAWVGLAAGLVMMLVRAFRIVAGETVAATAPTSMRD